MCLDLKIGHREMDEKTDGRTDRQTYGNSGYGVLRLRTQNKIDL